MTLTGHDCAGRRLADRVREGGAEDDQDWFARHHGRNHRMRRPIGREVDLFADGPPQGMALVVVRELKAGTRIRLGCWARRPPLNGEAAAAALYAALAADQPEVARIEALVQGGRL
jgi:hypothetical protein